jgi:hypothetical protein
VATGVVEAKAAKLFWLLDNGPAARRHAKRALMHLEKLIPDSALVGEARDVLAHVDMEVTAPSTSIADAPLPVAAVGA